MIVVTVLDQRRFRMFPEARDVNPLIQRLMLCFVFMVFIAGVPAGAASLSVRTAPLVLDPKAPSRTRFGKLTLLSGFVLRSDDKRFGGLSGLAIDPTGQILYAVSDHGHGLSARLTHDHVGRLTHIRQWEIVPLRTPDGRRTRRRQRDAEALVQEPDGAWLVAFEQLHRVWRYPPSPAAFTAWPEPVRMPRELSRAPRNGGPEGLTRLSDGRLLVLTERFKNRDGSFKGWLITGGRFAAIAYRPSNGFNPTDLAALPGGGLLLLERRYRFLSGLAIRLRHIARASIRPGTQLRGRVILRLAQPLSVDNFEGLVIRQGPQGGLLLYLLSDDNYNTFQRTLLVQFRLGPATIE